MTDQSHGDPRLDLAAERWGWHPSDWHVPARVAPRWWQVSARRHDAEMREVFGGFDRDAFWSQPGQSVYEDVGGAMLRRYRAMLGLPVEDPYTYPQAIADILSPQDRDTVRREALEEAAQTASLTALCVRQKRTKNFGLLRDPLPHEYGNEIAAAIRQLKEPRHD